jgi:hypothetical protein
MSVDQIDIETRIALEGERLAITVVGDADTLFGCFSAEMLEALGPMVRGAIEKVEG